MSRRAYVEDGTSYVMVQEDGILTAFFDVC